MWEGYEYEETNQCNLQGAEDGGVSISRKKEQSFFKTLEVLLKKKKRRKKHAEVVVHSFSSFDSFYITFTYYL